MADVALIKALNIHDGSRRLVWFRFREMWAKAGAENDPVRREGLAMEPRPTPPPLPGCL